MLLSRIGASLEGKSDTGSGSELDLTSTSNFESASDLYTRNGSSVGGIACFADASCAIETSSGAGCSETNSNQTSKEGHVTLKKKSLRSLRNFKLIHL